MKRWTIGLLLTLLTGVPAAGETVLGYFEGAATGNYGTGALPVTGWALADTGIKRVVIQVDGVDISQALYGNPRPLVEDIYPGFPDSAGPAFGYHLNTTDFTNEAHRVSAKVLTNGGTEVVLEGTRHITFNNNTAILHPFGKIETPQRNAELYGDCEGQQIWNPVGGWVLDLGVEIGDAGVGWVELLLDGSILANTRTGCSFEPDLGLFNCYGLPRLDIERGFPFALDAPTAGYRFLINVGALLNSGYVRGHHTLTIRAGDISTQNANVDEIPVSFYCIQDLPDEAAILGFIESPRKGRQYAGTIRFQGWALALDTLARVEVWVDGRFIGNALLGVDSRPGVAAQYPGWPGVAAPVWRLLFDSTELAEGVHQVEVIAVDVNGTETLIGERSFFVNNQID